ncbi:hypothetical protein RHO15_04410 [Utexia brackfieldae]|uniref:hypothetical protein n=1 Tax=Utexia brackfieldae TaxID=3074108 RepID=UPI00370DDCBB
MDQKSQGYAWKFQRIGGLDQVILSTADDIAHLNTLDPKLWVALSCPASGLEFDQKTLSLLDKDKDDRIRIPDIIDEVNWLKPRLTRLDSIVACANELPLSAINSETAEGQRLAFTAKAILNNINKPDASAISETDLSQSTLLNASNLFNGDGVLPPNPQFEADIVAFINDAVKVMGGVKDVSGIDGINNEIAKAFMSSLSSWLTWQQGVGSATTPLGDDTAEVWQLVQSLKDKVDDYFMRTQIASYAPQAQNALNVDEKFIVPAENGLLEDKALSELPLSKVEADKPLDLTQGINPIWRLRVERFGALVSAFLADKTKLTYEEWLNILQLLSPYATAVESKPTLVKVTVTKAPSITIDKLGDKRATEILNSDVADRFAALADKDSKTPAAAADVADVERLVMYHKNLYRLLMNFVSFHDFFDLDRRAAFQSGRLYIDGRCCSLCIPVTDVSKHLTLANYSELFLMYCECTRKNPPADGSQVKRTIVAAMTAGDADFLLDGRNGVFIDNQSNDWDARVVKIITKPISLHQAIWDPYKRFGRFITDQINKWAGSKDQALVDAASKAAQNVSITPAADAAPSKFDIGRSVGIFAAIGLAIGAIGTAIASIARSLFELQWWQLPLVFVALFLLISGPSVIMAWLKLRQRTLGPLLEASGWAINGKLKINLFLGGQLTSRAELPKNASRTLIDPMKKRYLKYWLVFWLAILLGAVATGAWLWHQDAFHLRSKLTGAPTSQSVVTTTATSDAVTTPAAAATPPSATEISQ